MEDEAVGEGDMNVREPLGVLRVVLDDELQRHRGARNQLIRRGADEVDVPALDLTGERRNCEREDREDY